MPGTPSLNELANAHGVATHVRDGSGRARAVAPEVVEAVLTSLGVECSEDAAPSADRHDGGTPSVVGLPDALVLRESWTPSVTLTVPATAEFEARIVLEDGSIVPLERDDELDAPSDTGSESEGEDEEKSEGGEDESDAAGESDSTSPQVVDLDLPGDLPLGYHELQVSAGGRRHVRPVVVTPATMTLPPDLAAKRGWGVAGQLYAVRSERSWGIGDAADLAELGTWAARSGADYVNVGPVNAADPVPTIDPNPYRPASRTALDPLAIRVEEVPEIGYLSAAEHQLVEWHGDDARRLNLTDEVDRDAVWESKRAALRMIFNVERSHRRRRDFGHFVESEAGWLFDYATWCVIALKHGLPASTWPEELQNPRSPEVAAFREEHADDVEFEAWLQWVAGAQFADAQREVKAAGMRIGVMHDIAPGVIDGGFEEWAWPEAFAADMRLGARAADGTVVDLGLAAMKPSALAENGYAQWRDIVRRTLARSGALRVERIGTLFRQWWIPQPSAAENAADAGTYVQFDHEALIGILLLEAHRAGALVVAGDEDETEPWIRDYLAERGVVSSAVLLDDTEGSGSRDPKKLPELAMTSLGAKDAPPSAALLTGSHLEEARRYGLRDDHAAYEERAGKRRKALVEALAARGLMTPRASVEDQVGALHRYLASAPSLLLTVRVADLVGDQRIVGEHGVTHVHALWRRPVAGPDESGVSLDDLMTSRRAKRVIRVVRARS